MTSDLEKRQLTNFLVAAVGVDEAVADVVALPFVQRSVPLLVSALEDLERAFHELDGLQEDDAIEIVATLCTRAYVALDVVSRRAPAS